VFLPVYAAVNFRKLKSDNLLTNSSIICKWYLIIYSYCGALTMAVSNFGSSSGRNLAVFPHLAKNPAPAEYLPEPNLWPGLENYVILISNNKPHSK